MLCVVTFALVWCLYRRSGFGKKKKAKDSEENLTRIEYDANRDSVEILEGVDNLTRLKQRVLVERIQSGIERNVENLSFLEDSFDSLFEFTQPVPVDDDVTMID